MPDQHRPRSRIRRYGFELLVVFLGVWLSLLAESWRQGAMERKDERTSLQRLAADMVEDTADIAGNITRAEHGFGGATWVLNYRRAFPPPADSLADYLARMGPCSKPGWNTSEYTALKGSGRLNIIADEELRQDIVELYESRAFLDWVHGLDCAESEAVLDLMSPYVEFGFAADVRRTGPDAEEWGGRRHPTVEAVPEPIRLMADGILMNRIAKLAAGRQFLLMQMEEELEDTKALRNRILDQLRD